MGASSEPTGDRLAEIKAAHETVMPGHTYTREYFPGVDATKFVGHTPARTHEAALDVVLAGVPWLVAELERCRVAAGILQKLSDAAVWDHFDDMTLVATVLNGEQVWFDLTLEEMAYLAAAVTDGDEEQK